MVFKLSRELLDRFGIYVQPINYPTVDRGMEMLRVAPTPHHTVDMMEYFVQSAVSLWKTNGLELKQPACASCRMTLLEKYWGAAGSAPLCNGSNCERFVAATASAC